MKRHSILVTFLFLTGKFLFSQVAVSDNGCQPNPSAAFEVNSATKGFLGPQVALTAIGSASPVANPAVGLLVFNTTQSGDLQKGYYFWNSQRWVPVNIPLGTNNGDMLCWYGNQWVKIPAGNPGDVLTFGTGKSPGVPEWNNIAREPSVLTDSAVALTPSTAMCRGNASDNGAIVTERGFCYDTVPAPTVTSNKTTAGTGAGSFTANLQGLIPNSTCYVRAYAINSVGTGYGNEKSFSTQSGIILLTTTPVSSVTAGTANSGGNITYDGGASVTTRGVCWSTSPGPTTAGIHTLNGSGLGSYVSNITGLLANTTYYVRAYATNSVGTCYGEQDTLTTSPTAVPPTVVTTPASDVTQVTAASGGTISSDGGELVTFRGVCWNTTPAPVIAGNHTTDGSGIGSFTSSLTGLSSNTQYYIRAYAVNTGSTAFGNELAFITLASLTTNSVTAITQTAATCGGNIATGGGQGITARGVCWGTSANPVIAGSHTTDGTGTGAFTSSLTGLTGNTLYYVRAYATGSSGTSYGNQQTFTTSPVLATVTTTAATDILMNSATSGGNVTSGGGASVTARGVCWNTSPNPTTANSKTSDGTGTGVFVSSLTGLTANTLYYVRAYATNSVGTSYGNTVTFTTILNQLLPTVTTTDISGSGTTYATGGGNITSDGGSAIVFRGVCWSTSPDPTIANSHTTDGTGTGTFISNLTGLTPNTLFYVRAYAMNSIGTAYGNGLSFTTFADCGSLTINHVAGAVAPVNKSVIYGTVTGIPGEATKCWITSNLGSDHQATAVSDATEASAGWYWQFNRKQGYKHDGTNRIPNTTWISSISENSNWISASDPCNIELGTTWRIPTYTEWYNVDNTGSWTTWTDPWNSGLRLHAAGYLNLNTGALGSRSSEGNYWSSTQYNTSDGRFIIFGNGLAVMTEFFKTYGYPLRCVRVP